MKNKKLLLIFSHRLTAEQKKSATTDLGTKEFVYLPEYLQAIWSNVNSKKFESKKLDSIKKFVSENSCKDDFILIQGEWRFTYELVNFCRENGLKAIYSSTERNNVENILPDGEVQTKSIFKHVAFKPYY
jgi:hypothetical protein